MVASISENEEATVAGLSINFYKPDKPTSSFKPDLPSYRAKRNFRKSNDSINKGVSHKIKRPKLKAKNNKIKKSLRAAQKVHPRLPSNRSPRKNSINGKKKHILSSPGISLLDSLQDGPLDSESTGKFFTTRSRVAANVNMTSTINLLASNGEVTLKKPLKVVNKMPLGKKLEEELECLLFVNSFEQNGNNIDTCKPLMSSIQSSRPVPTRFTDSPSKKRASKDSEVNRTPTRKSPRKLAMSLESREDKQLVKTPTRKSPRKLVLADVNGNKSDIIDDNLNHNGVRRSPRKHKSTEANGNFNSELLEETFSENMFAVFNPDKVKDGHSPHNLSKKNLKKFRLAKADYSQMIIDAGQKEFGARHCNTCGIVYEIGDPLDESMHQEYHNGFLLPLRFIGWKHERQIRDTDILGGRVLMIISTDGAHFWKKVDDVLKIVDNELGFAENRPVIKEHSTGFLYVVDRLIVGCLISEKLKYAQRVIPNSSKVLCCDEKPVRVWCGVNRLWVLCEYRSRGIASILVDVMRENVMRPHFLSVNEFAFSDPTESGVKFAARYTKKEDFLVYRR